MKKLNQIGAVDFLTTFILFLGIAIIVFTGWFVWNTKNKVYSSSALTPTAAVRR